MRSIQIALLGALAATGLGLSMPAQAQDGYAPGYRVSRPLPIRIRPRSWLDAGNVVEPGNGSVSNPATNPVLIAQSNALTPVYGRNDRFNNFVDPITNGPFIGARSAAIRNIDYSAIDVIDPTSYAARYGSPY